MGRRKGRRGGGDDDDDGERVHPLASACSREADIVGPDQNDGGVIAVTVPAGSPAAVASRMFRSDARDGRR